MAIPILHMASLARAGETLLLKLMAAHPRVHVPLQIVQAEDQDDVAFVARVRAGLSELSLGDPYARLRGLSETSVIVVKQGVWEHHMPFRGFALVRQPFAVIASLLEFNRKEGLDRGLSARKRYAKTYARLMRWARDMDSGLAELIAAAPTPVEAAAVFFSYRVTKLAGLGLPVVHYERLVERPRDVLGEVCAVLGIEFAPQMLEANTRYQGEAPRGHGYNDLGRSVDRDSLECWRDLSLENRAVILRHTYASAVAAGYELTVNAVRLRASLARSATI